MIFKNEIKTNHPDFIKPVIAISFIGVLILGFSFVLFDSQKFAEGGFESFFWVIFYTFIIFLLSIGWYPIIFPKELEIVIDDNVIRWGNIKRRSKQKTLQLSEIKEIRLKCGVDSDLIYAILKDDRNIRLPEYLLSKVLEHQKFIDFLENKFPDVIIKDSH